MLKPQLHFVASNAPDAVLALETLSAEYGQYPLETATHIVALGGDGLMLDTLHRHMDAGIPIFGMNKGTIGFLMNEYQPGALLERIESATLTIIHPLRLRAETADGEAHEALAINEVSLHRQTGQASKIQIAIDGRERISEVICDGVLVATPAGSSAYNYSAHGPIIPLSAGVLALTPISPFRPRRWRGALLPREAKVEFTIIESSKRPVSVSTDAREIRDCVRAHIEEAPDINLKLLFDPEHNLEERILNEQFTP
ncbi:MAG: NAD kinase [Pseudomonadota bacterium]